MWFCFALSVNGGDLNWTYFSMPLICLGLYT